MDYYALFTLLHSTFRMHLLSVVRLKFQIHPLLKTCDLFSFLHWIWNFTRCSCAYIYNFRKNQNQSVRSFSIITIESSITNIAHRCSLFEDCHCLYRLIFMWEVYPFRPYVCNILDYCSKTPYVCYNHSIVHDNIGETFKCLIVIF